MFVSLYIYGNLQNAQQSVKHNVNYELQLIIMYQYLFINSNKCTTPEKGDKVTGGWVTGKGDSV